MSISEKLQTIADNMQKVYDAGYDKGDTNGYNQGLEEGIADGKQLQYDEFWDTFQENGARGQYNYAFAGEGWTDESFKPKYDIIVKGQTHMFSNCKIVDIAECLSKAGVTFDTSQTTSFTYFLQNGLVTERFPILNLTSANKLQYLFYNNPALKCIDKIILKEDGSQEFTENYSFGILPALEEIRFEGKIGKSISFADSPLLTSASVQSIIDALATVEEAQALTLNADITLTDEQKATIEERGWDLVQ